MRAIPSIRVDARPPPSRTRRSCAKPDLNIYHEMLRRLRVAPSSVVFIDDNPANVIAAAAAGIDGMVFTSVADLKLHLARG